MEPDGELEHPVGETAPAGCSRSERDELLSLHLKTVTRWHLGTEPCCAVVTLGNREGGRDEDQLLSLDNAAQPYRHLPLPCPQVSLTHSCGFSGSHTKLKCPPFCAALSS